MAVVHAQLRPSVAALFDAASPDVVKAICDAHPMLDSATRPRCPLLKLLALLPPAADSAACRAALTAWCGSHDASNGPFCIMINNDSTPELCARAICQLQALGVRNVALELSGYKLDQTLMRAVEPLLAQQTAPGGMPVLQLTVSPANYSTRADRRVSRGCAAALRSKAALAARAGSGRRVEQTRSLTPLLCCTRSSISCCRISSVSKPARK